jgi:hypothetical protein
MGNQYKHPEQSDADLMKIYATGPFCMSVCVPADWDIEKVEKIANIKSHCGTTNGWRVYENHFATGQVNPCLCNEMHNRKHWLLSA